MADRARGRRRPSWQVARCSRLGACVARRRSTRTQLAILLGVLALGLLLARLAVRSRCAAGATTWSRWDWVGAVVLGVGAVLAFVALHGPRSHELGGTRRLLYKDRIVEHGELGGRRASRSAIGVLPVVARSPRSRARRERAARPEDARVRRRHERAALVRLRLVRGDQGRVHLDGLRDPRRRAQPHLPLPDPVRRDRARSSRAGRPRLGDRARAAVFTSDRRHGDRRSRLDNYPYYEAHGLSILALREPRARLAARADRDGRRLLTSSRSVVAALLLARRPSARAAARPSRRRRGRGRRRVVAWNLTAEVYAAKASTTSQRARRAEPRRSRRLGRPRDGRRLGRRARAADQRRPARTSGSTEFFNRVDREDVERRRHGARPRATRSRPTSRTSTARSAPDPETDYVLAVQRRRGSSGAQVVARRRTPRSYRLDGPIRLRSNQTGIAADGWILGDPGDESVPRGPPTTASTSPTDGPGSRGRDALPRDVLPRAACGCRASPACGSAAGTRLRQAAARSRARPTPTHASYVPACAVRDDRRSPTPADGPWRVEVDDRRRSCRRGRSAGLRRASAARSAARRCRLRAARSALAARRPRRRT